MNIQINGKPTALAQPCTIATLLQLLGYHDRFIAVARNREHVRRSDFDATIVDHGDEIEILAPMAGG